MDWRLVRMGRGLLTIFIALNLGFVLIHMLPGGPASYLRQQLQKEGMSDAQVRRIVRLYMNVEPNATLVEQYVDYWNDLLFHFSLGKSIWYNEPVIQLVAQYLPWTVLVMSLVSLATFPVGILYGSLMAYWEGTRFDKASTGFLLTMNGVPEYIVAMFLAFWLAMQWGLFPWRETVNWTLQKGFNPDFMISVIYHAILPALSFTFPYVGGLSVRAYAIRILGKDYIRVARLRGVPTSHIVTKYVARNSLLPSYTDFVRNIPALVGGSITVEFIFQYKGMGWLFYQATIRRDYPLMMAALLFSVILTVFALVFAELTYGYIDPRAKEGGENVETY